MWARAWSGIKWSWRIYRIYKFTIWLVGWLMTSGVLLAFVERLRTAPIEAKIFLVIGVALFWVLLAWALAPFVAALHSHLRSKMGRITTPGGDLAIECEPKIAEKRVYLVVTNREAPQEFVGQVVGIEGARPESPGYWLIRWQGTALSRSQILTGASGLLELVELDAMGTALTIPGRLGRFWFLCPEDARQEVWLGEGDMAEARRLGVDFMYYRELTVKVRIASVQTSKARVVTLTLGIDRQLNPVVAMRS
jgi:hypothetical protein